MKIKYGDNYDWMYQVPADWHLMKTAAEVIKYILQDGGFKCYLGNVVVKGTYHMYSGKTFIMY